MLNLKKIKLNFMLFFITLLSTKSLNSFNRIIKINIQKIKKNLNNTKIINNFSNINNYSDINNSSNIVNYNYNYDDYLINNIISIDDDIGMIRYDGIYITFREFSYRKYKLNLICLISMILMIIYGIFISILDLAVLQNNNFIFNASLL